jgi:plastocyanin
VSTAPQKGVVRRGPYRAYRVLAAAAFAAVLTVGCFSDRAPVGPAGELFDCLLPADAVRRGDQFVVIRGFAFLPDTVRIERGRTVTWVNCEPPNSDAHTTTADDRAWDSPLLLRGDSYSHTFHDVGTFGYFCLPHSAMRGEVTVR